MAYNAYSITAKSTAPLPTPYPQAGWIDVTWYGAVGDNSTDDTAAIQAAITAAPAGGQIVIPWGVSGIYKITSALTISKALTILNQGGATIRQATAGVGAISITASNVTIDGLVLSGFQYATWNAAEIAILASGTFHAGSAPDYISNICIKNTRITGFGAMGIQPKYIDGLVIQNNTISNMPEAGIGEISCKHAVISGNTISNITGVGVSSSNAWGIYTSRFNSDSGNLTSQPRSQDITISGNTIQDVPSWTGIDTHGGDGITVTGNTIRNVYFGVAIGASNNDLGTSTYAPLNCTVTGNSINSNVTDGTRGYGITFTGTATQYATGTIVGNSVLGFGTSTSSIIPAINLSLTNGLVISGNTILYPSAVGIYGVANPGLTITGNVIVDPWTNDVGLGAVFGIRIDGNNNSVTISGNSILHVDKVATYLITTSASVGIRYESGSGNSGMLGFNLNQGFTLIFDPDGNFASTLPHYGLYSGTGAPSFTALKGSLYLRLDGSSTSTRAYINTNGSTTWTAVTTAA